MATNGYVVRSTGNLFLSRSKKYVLQRSDELTWVVSYAWVHSESELLEGGNWTEKAVLVYPARYDAKRDTTVVMGDPIPYADFLHAHQSEPVAEAK
jgi:hypothetical protein